MTRLPLVIALSFGVVLGCGPAVSGSTVDQQCVHWEGSPRDAFPGFEHVGYCSAP